MCSCYRLLSNLLCYRLAMTNAAKFRILQNLSVGSREINVLINWFNFLKIFIIFSNVLGFSECFLQDIVKYMKERWEAYCVITGGGMLSKAEHRILCTSPWQSPPLFHQRSWDNGRITYWLFEGLIVGPFLSPSFCLLRELREDLGIRAAASGATCTISAYCSSFVHHMSNPFARTKELQMLVYTKTTQIAGLTQIINSWGPALIAGALCWLQLSNLKMTHLSKC